MKPPNQGVITSSSAFVKCAFVVYPSVRRLETLGLTLIKLICLMLSLNLQICTDHIPRLSSASTEMQEQCRIGNDLRLLRTGVSTYILNILLCLTPVPHLSSQFTVFP